MTAQASSFISNNSNNDGSSKAMSKSKKKRMKRKAAAAAEAASKAGVGSGSSLNPSRKVQASGGGSGTNGENGKANAKHNTNPLDPHYHLKCELFDKGYSSEEVDLAMEEMWNIGLPYDELESVLAFLLSKRDPALVDAGFADGALSAPSSTVVDAELVTESAESAVVDASDISARATKAVPTGPSRGGNVPVKGNMETDSASTAPTLFTSSSSEDPIAVSKKANSKESNEEKDNSASATKVRNAVDNKRGAPKRPVTSPVAAPMGIISKLCLVAKYHNIHDAIFALTEWATKIAKPQELGLLCTESEILPTLVRRSIIECKDNEEYTNILPSLVTLLCAMLRQRPSRSTTEHIRSILVNARKAVKFCPSVAITKSGEVVSSAREAEGGNKTSSNAQSSDVVEGEVDELLDAKIARVVSTAVMNAIYVHMICSAEKPILGKDAYKFGTADVGAANARSETDFAHLLAMRDRQKLAAEKSGILAFLSIKAVAGNGMSDMNGVGTNGIVAEKKLFDETCGEIGDFFAQNRTELGNIEEKLKRCETMFEESKQTFETNLQCCRNDKEANIVKREELLRQLKQLDEEDALLEKKEKQLTNELVDCKTKFESEQFDLNGRLHRRKELLKVANACKSVEGAVNQFQYSLLQGEATNGGKHEKNIGTFFSAMSNYMKTEADCVEFLKERVGLLTVQIQKLEIEITQCRNLGMTTNVNQMSQLLEEKSKYEIDDESAIKAIQRDAREMEKLLIERMEILSQSGNKVLSNFGSVFDGIVEALSRIGLDVENVASFIPEPEVEVVENASLVQNGEAGEIVSSEAKVKHLKGEEIRENGLAVDRDRRSVAPVSRAISPPRSTGTAAVMPKLSWASAGPLLQNPGKKSFLEIQKEEMTGRS